MFESDKAGNFNIDTLNIRLSVGALLLWATNSAMVGM